MVSDKLVNWKLNSLLQGGSMTFGLGHWSSVHLSTLPGGNLPRRGLRQQSGLVQKMLVPKNEFLEH